ncbi:recombinase family protein [Micromonospora arida]|uniref:recombinase family protein n=1 Tax=Micromonospora arida TaxID=2203715 RepID=UPI003CF3AA48
MIDDLRALCVREDFEEVALHIDDGVSGAIRDRPGFMDWVADAREDRADVLLAYHVDRMTREGLPVAAMLLDVVEGKDPATGRVVHRPVRLKDAKGLDSNDGDGFRMIFVIRAEIARAERDRMRDRSSARARRLRLAGRFAGGPVPTGYRIERLPDDSGTVLALEDTEAEALRECARRLLAGDSQWDVVRWMNREGTPPRRGKEWQTGNLAETLRSNHLLGWVTVDGEVVRDEEGRAFAPFPAVLDFGTAQAVREILKPNPVARPRGRRPSRLLSGVVRCGGCWRPMNVAPKGGSVEYRCQTYSTGQECPQRVTVSAPRLEEYVEREYLDGFGHLAQFRLESVVSADTELAEVEDAIAATMRELGRAATAETFARLQRQQARRDELAALPRDVRVIRVPTGLTQAEAWAAGDVHDRRRMLLDAIDVLSIGRGRRGPQGLDPSRVTLVWREGDLDPDD